MTLWSSRVRGDYRNEWRMPPPWQGFQPAIDQGQNAPATGEDSEESRVDKRSASTNYRVMRF